MSKYDNNQVNILLYVFAQNKMDVDNYNAATLYASQMTGEQIQGMSQDPKWNPTKGNYYLAKMRVVSSAKAMIQDMMFDRAKDQGAVNDGSMNFWEWLLTLLLIISLITYLPAVLIFKIAPWLLFFLFFGYLISFIIMLVRQLISNEKPKFKTLLLQIHLLSVVYFPFTGIGIAILIYLDIGIIILIGTAILSLILSVITVFLLNKLHDRIIRKRELNLQDNPNQLAQETKIKDLEREVEVLRNKIDREK